MEPDLDRIETLRTLVDNRGFGLEIGPSHAPVFARADGFNVETLDHASAEELREKYRFMGVDPSRIEEVTYVSDGRPIHEVINRRGEYDFIFSSHAIEHVTDIVEYFQSCELLLKHTGIAALAIPDRRYTFDAMQQVSTTGQALEAHYRSTGRHSPAAIFDFTANASALGGAGTWAQSHRGPVSHIESLQSAKDRFDQAITPGTPYQDVHGWYFTPSSFRLIMHDLKALGLISLSEIYMMDIGALEFHVALSRDHIGNGLDRLSIAKAALREQAMAGLQILAGEDPVCAAMLDLASGQPAITVSADVNHSEPGLHKATPGKMFERLRRGAKGFRRSFASSGG